MTPQLEDTLVEALDLLEQGVPMVRILAHYPDVAEELRPLLIIASNLERFGRSASAEAERESKSAFLRAAETMPSKSAISMTFRLRRILVSGLAVLFLLLCSGIIVATLSVKAIPGDVLYGSKILLEEARLNYSANPDTANALIEEFRQERLEEITTLLILGRNEQITYIGTLEEMAGNVWNVEGIPVTITPSTRIRNEIEEGFLIQVTGRTAAGVLLADEIEVHRGSMPTPDETVPQTNETLPSVTEPTPENTPGPQGTLTPDVAPASVLPTPTLPTTATPGNDVLDETLDEATEVYDSSAPGAEVRETEHTDTDENGVDSSDNSEEETGKSGSDRDNPSKQEDSGGESDASEEVEQDSEGSHEQSEGQPDEGGEQESSDS